MGIMNHQLLETDIQKSIWFQVPKPVVKPRLRFFCFTYAGGSAAAYRNWHHYLADDIELCSVQLPGRGARFNESAYTNLNDLVHSLLHAFSPYLDVPYVFFGHSMGAQVAFELTRSIRMAGLPEPRILFVSARRAPSLPIKCKKVFHNLPEREFLEEVRQLNGTPAEAFENEELMNLISPVLRADFEVIETAEYSPSEPLELPLIVLAGAQDQHVSIDELEHWSALTAGHFELRLFSGDHFYIHSATAELFACMNGFIDQWLVDVRRHSASKNATNINYYNLNSTLP